MLVNKSCIFPELSFRKTLLLQCLYNLHCRRLTTQRTTDLTHNVEPHSFYLLFSKYAIIKNSTTFASFKTRDQILIKYIYNIFIFSKNLFRINFMFFVFVIYSHKYKNYISLD